MLMVKMTENGCCYELCAEYSFGAVIEKCKGHGSILHTFVPSSVRSLKDGGSCI
jgi:hypothetical protein